MAIVAPSILSADFSKLLEEIKSVEDAEFLHIDIMDGHFVPNITIGPLVVNSIKNKVDMIFDCHLMISNPLKYAIEFIKSGAHYITFHIEALNNHEEVIELINLVHENNCLVGISVKPNTDVKVLDPYLELIDLALVMSVEPGFGGQSFMECSLDKIKYLSEMKKKNNYKYLIEVDGGINEKTADLVKSAGVEVIVAGTYVFKNEDRKKIISDLKK
jgi:ribulose-phosphate 3-epimerase